VRALHGLLTDKYPEARHVQHNSSGNLRSLLAKSRDGSFVNENWLAGRNFPNHLLVGQVSYRLLPSSVVGLDV